MGSEQNITTNEAAIWLRLIRPERGDLSSDAARDILKLSFESHDLERMHALAIKKQSAALTGAEEAELEGFRRVGFQLDLWHSKARQSLKQFNAS